MWKLILLPLLAGVLCFSAMQAALSGQPEQPLAEPVNEPAADVRPAVVLQAVPTPDGNGELMYEGAYVMSGARHFYRVYGRWPASWREVCECGLFQARLMLPDGREVDPDDPTPPAVQGEVRYRPAADAGSTPAVLTVMERQAAKPGASSAAGTLEVRSVSLERGRTYAEIFKAKAVIQNEEVGAAMAKQIAYLVGDEKRLLQLGLGDMILDGLLLYSMAHGDYPHTWEEFIESGLSPVGAQSINPLTGEVLRCDGSVGDYGYRYCAPTADRPVIADFRCIWPPEHYNMFSVWP